MTRSARETAEAFYASVHAGDFEQLFSVLSDDCTLEYQGPPSIPFAGIFKGKDKCRIFFGHVAEDVDIQEFRQDEFIVDGNMVAVTGHLKLLMHATGRVYDSDYVHVHNIRDGQIARFRDFQDTAKAAFVSTPIETPVR